LLATLLLNIARRELAEEAAAKEKRVIRKRKKPP